MTYYIGFDLDNTLYDHQQFVVGAYLDIAKKVGRLYGISVNEFYGNIFSKWQKHTSRCTHIFSDTLKEYDIYSPETEKELVSIYRNHTPSITLYPHVRTGLKQLVKSGFTLGLLTDGQPDVQRRKIASLDIERHFEAIVITGDFGRNYYKPHPRGFVELAKKIKTHAAAMVYVGDNPHVDFETPKNMGMTTIRIQTGEYKNIPHSSNLVDHNFLSTKDAISWILTQRIG